VGQDDVRLGAFLHQRSALDHMGNVREIKISDVWMLPRNMRQSFF
jgi:hypothetical protein